MRRLAVLAAAVGVLGLPAAAVAHPLGNFTVNRYAGVEIAGNRTYVEYALDLAEIPALREGDAVRAPGFAARVARQLELRIDGERARLAPLSHRVADRPGAAGLRTLRFEAVYEADRTGRALSFRDGSFPGRVGWREVVVRASNGARVERSTVPASSLSKRLTAYPRGRLGSPLDVRAAQATVAPGSQPGPAPALAGAVPAEPRSGGLEGVVERADGSIGFLLVALGLALFWGAAHALSPGHGKAIVAGYLVGTRGRPRDAFLLGAIVTVTHTIGVFALGLVTLALSAWILPEQLYPWLNLVAALLVLGVGAGILRSRLEEWLHARAHARGALAGHHGHGHGHGHGHRHGARGHSHELPAGGGLRALVGAGVSGGIVPCPTALVVLLAAISLQRVELGLLLIVAFSIGLAATITAVGLLVIAARGAVSRIDADSPLVRLLPAASALVVLGLGLAMTVRALPALA